jgi:hypothetical protein
VVRPKIAEKWPPLLCWILSPTPTDKNWCLLQARWGTYLPFTSGRTSQGNVLFPKLPYSCSPLASILPYRVDILRSHNFVQSLHMAPSRSNNEVTSSSGRKLVWRSHTSSHRVGSTAISSDLVSSSAVPALVTPPSFTRNMSKNWVGMYVYAGFIRCVDILVYAARQATYRSYSGKPDFSRWTRSQYLTS